MSKWQWILSQITRELWFRAVLLCVLGVVSALLAIWFSDYIPEHFVKTFGAYSVEPILRIIASSMLAVTIFSLSTMVAAYSAASSSTTPRATKLLLQDRTSQNALSTFIGSFLFSLVGLISISMGIYQDSGRLLLFGVTIIVIMFVVIVLLQWVHHLSRLGRVSHTIDIVEAAAAGAIRHRIENPYLGAQPLEGYKPASSHTPVILKSIGYVQNVDIPALSEVAEKNKAKIHVIAQPGKFNDGHAPVVWVSKKIDEDDAKKICSAYSIGDDRSFDQDPRFGLVVLSEIASRALSPAVNDPGTAISIVGTALRILSPWVTKDPAAKEDVKYDNVYVPALETADMFEDIFKPIARDGAAMIEVCIRLQKALQTLSDIGDKEAKKAAKEQSALVLSHGQKALALDEDKKRLKDLSL